VASDALLPRPRCTIAEGAVHVPDWLGLDEQRALLAACREWARPRASGRPALRATRLPSGGWMSVRTVCLGWHWYPYGYSRTVEDGEPVRPFPHWLAELGRRAVAEGYRDPVVDYRPDTALVNFYHGAARMGLHRDADERSPDPVVSMSLGDACVFRFGTTQGRRRPWTDLELRSGDLFVFGGPSRLAYHGVPRILAGTADPALGLIGRLNVTLRVSGLTGDQ
jgi:alkylated DNA repair protein (DNA oxidative demethylase)